MSVVIPGRLVFVHVPRTGGTSIETALRAAIPNAPTTPPAQKHLSAWEIRDTMPIAAWERARKFAVVRDPHQTLESIYRLLTKMAATISPADNRAAGGPSLDLLTRIMRRTARYTTFGQWVRHEWLGEFSPLRPGGFRRTWCLGLEGEDLGVDVIPYPRLAEAWPGICRDLGIACELPRVNAAPGPPLDWPEAERTAARELCWMDLEAR